MHACFSFALQINFNLKCHAKQQVQKICGHSTHCLLLRGCSHQLNAQWRRWWRSSLLAVLGTLQRPWNPFLTNHWMAWVLKDVISRTSRHKNFASPSTISGVITPILNFFSLFVSASMLEATQWRSRKGKAPAKSRASWWWNNSSRHPVVAAADYTMQHAAAISETTCNWRIYAQYKDEVIVLSFWDCRDIYFSFT